MKIDHLGRQKPIKNQDLKTRKKTLVMPPLDEALLFLGGMVSDVFGQIAVFARLSKMARMSTRAARPT